MTALACGEGPEGLCIFIGPAIQSPLTGQTPPDIPVRAPQDTGLLRPVGCSLAAAPLRLLPCGCSRALAAISRAPQPPTFYFLLPGGEPVSERQNPENHAGLTDT